MGAAAPHEQEGEFCGVCQKAWPCPNVLPVSPRTEGSGRPNKDRVLTSVWISKAGMDELDRIAETYGVKRSDVIRLALKHGLAEAEKELKRNA